MKLAILFWCYKKVEVCVSRLQLLRHFNPQTPIYVLFGGPPAEAQKFESELLPYIEDFYFYPEQKDSFWKYWHGDILISQWFKESGHKLE
ncbi:MAG: hypothetical protein K2Q25_02670 [Mycobacteriaceae bacterium]|nr:hypothetical protein [Mycobacteriaceae bacterium]